MYVYICHIFQHDGSQLNASVPYREKIKWFTQIYAMKELRKNLQNVKAFILLLLQNIKGWYLKWNANSGGKKCMPPNHSNLIVGQSLETQDVCEFKENKSALRQRQNDFCMHKLCFKY